MPRRLCLTRQCLGLQTRIECAILPLSVENGLWTLLCAAGLANAQPTAIKAQGPFHGALVAEEVLAAIIENLALLGYVESIEPSIWSLHMQGEMRRLNAGRGHHLGSYQFHPET